MGLQTKPLISDGLRTLAHVDGHSWVDGQTTLPGFTDFSPDEIRMRSEEHTSELQSLMRISYAVFCLKKKKNNTKIYTQKNTKHRKRKRNNIGSTTNNKN